MIVEQVHINHHPRNFCHLHPHDHAQLGLAPHLLSISKPPAPGTANGPCGHANANLPCFGKGKATNVLLSNGVSSVNIVNSYYLYII